MCPSQCLRSDPWEVTGTPYDALTYLANGLNFKLFGITYLVGKIKFKLLLFGPLAKWVFLVQQRTFLDKQQNRGGASFEVTAVQVAALLCGQLGWKKRLKFMTKHPRIPPFKTYSFEVLWDSSKLDGLVTKERSTVMVFSHKASP